MKNKKDIVFIIILISLFNVNKEYGKEAIEQKNNIVVKANNFYGNMSNEKGIILKWSKVPKSKGYVIYRNNKKIATIKSNKIKLSTLKKYIKPKYLFFKSALNSKK